MTHPPNKRLQKASDNMSKLILGVATNSNGNYKTRIDGKRAKSYETWQNMVYRAYCPKYQARYPTYIGCSVSDEWLDYQVFAEWFENHEYSKHGYHLDKDLLLPDNKIYAPDRCVFVPQELNKLLIDSGAIRGQYPRGVYFNKERNKFMASIKINGKQKYLGLFETEIDAYHAYKKAKEQYVKDSATHWRDDIADNVFDALMNWELG